MITRDQFLEFCRLCERPLKDRAQWGWESDLYSATCEVCGQYRMTFQAYHSPLRGEEGDFWLRAAARQHWEVSAKPLVIVLDEMEQLADEHRSTSVAQNVSKFLNYLVLKSPRPSSCVTITFAVDYTVIDALSEDEVKFYIDHLRAADLITATRPPGADAHEKQLCKLTVKGWDHVLGTSSSSAEHGRVFVAMWFDQSMEAAYGEGIAPSLLTLGYQPICMNRVFQNDDINFTILTELRRAQFVVADITGARGGVYFEAGFAKALGRDVFFTCREDRFLQDKHFDTEHFQHTLWKTPGDLRLKLYEKVMALKGPGPHHSARP